MQLTNATKDLQIMYSGAVEHSAMSHMLSIALPKLQEHAKGLRQWEEESLIEMNQRYHEEMARYDLLMVAWKRLSWWKRRGRPQPWKPTVPPHHFESVTQVVQLCVTARHLSDYVKSYEKCPALFEMIDHDGVLAKIIPWSTDLQVPYKR